MRFDLSRYWYRRRLHLFMYPLLPLSWLFGLGVYIRRQLFRYGIFPSEKFSVPVIVVGNLTVGGTGKTPFVIWLADFLRQQGYKPGIVTRGVGSKKGSSIHHVRNYDLAQEVGDEAVLLRHKTDCPVVIGVNRPAAVRHLLNTSSCNVVICDDGLQHYRLGRHIEIVIVDGARHFGNERLLPAGPLREPISRLKEVDLVIYNNGLNENEWMMKVEPLHLVSLQRKELKKKLSDFANQSIHAVAGIGHPEKFFSMLAKEGLNVIPHVYPDHHPFEAKDIDFEDQLPVIMTEKDAVKCHHFAHDLCWFLDVQVKVNEPVQKRLLELMEERRVIQ